MAKETEQATQIDGRIFEVRTPSDELLVFRAFAMTREGMYNLVPLVPEIKTPRVVPEEILLNGGMISPRLRVIGINPKEKQSS